MKNISVIGAGYVGLVIAACLAEVGEIVIFTKPMEVTSW